MDQYAGRLLADRYRLPRPPSEVFELVESRAFDTASGQEVLVRQVPLPEVVEAEVLDAGAGPGAGGHQGPGERATRTPDDPVVRRALEAAAAAAALPDHARLDQIFDVFVQGDGLWIVSELVPAQPLAALLAEQRLTPYRAAEVAADLLAALRVVHAHGWAHRNITARTVLICDDGRALLTGLAAGAAEEVLCGYDPFPAGPARDEPAAPPPAPPAPQDPGGPVDSTPPRGMYRDVIGTPQPAGGPEDQPQEAAAPAGTELSRGEGPQWPPGFSRPADGEAPSNSGQDGGRYPASAPPGAAGPEAPGSPRAELAAGPPGGHGLPEGYHARADYQVPDSRGAPDGTTVGEPYAAHDRYAPRDAGPPPGWNAPGRSTAGAPPAHYGDRPGRSDYDDRPGHSDYPAGHRTSAPVDANGEDGSPEQGLLARVREQGGLPVHQEPEVPRYTGPSPAPPGAFPASWDFESGQPPGTSGRAALTASREEADPPPPVPQPRAQGPGPGQPSPAALERASRFGAIAAYRAGTRAGAQAVNGQTQEADAADPAGASDRRADLPARRGSGPTELPGNPRRSRAVSTGWESAPPRAAVPARRPVTAAPAVVQPAEPAPRPAGTGIVPDPARRYRGPDSARAAERARQARMTTVGPVTERWAPEQAGPVYDHWRLAPPVGPAADLWALGALLFRAVQGHPPYPEEDTAELAQAVCAEQPAFAEECGALRPVVESLLRQDPTERPSAEELRGWLRSIIRSAPEPDIGRHTLTGPPLLEAGRPADPTRLPIVRHRGELVSRRQRTKGGGDPRRLGRVLLVLMLFLVAGGMAYALLFMSDTDGDGQDPGSAPPAPDESAPAEGAPEQERPAESGEPESKPAGSAEPTEPDGSPNAPPPPEGYESVTDPAGFRITLPDGWQRQEGGNGQVVFTGPDGLRLTVVPGRDSAEEFGDVPMDYQLQSQPELQDYRDTERRSSGSLRSVRQGEVQWAEGTFVWDGGGGEEFVRNRAMLIGGDYHVVMLRGGAAQQDGTGELFQTVVDGYRVTGG